MNEQKKPQRRFEKQPPPEGERVLKDLLYHGAGYLLVLALLFLLIYLKHRG